jgi:Prion-inhibition and propagation
VSKFVVTAKDFPIEAKALRIGFIIEAARLKTWARIWSISTENDLYLNVTANTSSTNVLQQEAEDASLDLVILQEILSNMWELISEGKSIRSSHESVLSDTVCNPYYSARSW